MAAVTIRSNFGAQEERKSVTVSTFSASICHEVMGPDAMILIFSWWISSQPFHSPLSPSSRGCLVPLRFLPLEWYHLHIWSCWYFSWQSWFQLVIHPAQYFVWCTQFFSLHSILACFQAPAPSLVLFYPGTASLVYPIVTKQSLCFLASGPLLYCWGQKISTERNHLRSSVADSF